MPIRLKLFKRLLMNPCASLSQYPNSPPSNQPPSTYIMRRDSVEINIPTWSHRRFLSEHFQLHFSRLFLMLELIHLRQLPPITTRESQAVMTFYNSFHFSRLRNENTKRKVIEGVSRARRERVLRDGGKKRVARRGKTNNKFQLVVNPLILIKPNL